MKKLFAIIAGLLFLILPQPAFAQYVVQTPSPNSQININKLVQDPRNGNFVENLNSNEFLFGVNQEIDFRLDVRNTGQTDLNNIAVSDTLPAQLAFLSGPGAFSDSTNTLNFSVDKLSPGETKTFVVKSKVRTTFEGNVCVTNFSQASVNNLVSQDTAVVCLGKAILPSLRELPKTGVSSVALYLSTSLLFASLAIGFAKRSV